MTKQRRMILNIIQNSMDHLTADQIYLRAKDQMPAIAVGTVYRNLNLMVNDGEIRKVYTADGPDRFDKTLRRHDHVVCNCCGRMEDLEIPDMTPQIEVALGTEILRYDINVKYICPQCRKQKTVNSF